ncbi:MAG: ROK family protein [Acidimicrobiales bacterium]
MTEQRSADPSDFAGGTPSLLRAINERTVLETVRRLGAASRSQIADSTALSKPTVSQALAALLKARLVREAGRTSGSQGRTAQLYELNAAAGWVLGLDVGRDRVRAAVADLNGDIAARHDERARIRSARTLIEQIGEVGRGVVAEARVPRRRVTHATIGSPGVFEPTRRKLTLAESLPGWGREGVIEALQEELDVQVSIENDVNVATVGEQLHGLGKGVPNFVFLHVGVGVGLGLVLDGRLFRGSTGAAGEVGYLPFGDERLALPVKTRKRDELGATVGSEGVVAEARRLGMKGRLTARSVFAAARRSDPTAQQVVNVEAKRIARTIAAVVPVVDPELVVLGGGIGRNGDLLLEPIRAELRSALFHPRIEASALGEDGPVLGAVTLALEQAQERLFSRAEGRGGIVV